MKKYVATNEEGDILCEYVLPDESPSPLNTIEVFADVGNKTHWIDLEGPVAYTSDQLTARLSPPSPLHKWINKKGGWEDPRTVQDFKDAKWGSIKESREAAINAPLLTPYGTFDSDPKSRQNITDAILMLKSLEDLGSPTTIDFTLADDTARTLTTAEMVMVGLLLGQKIQAAHAQARALRGALDLATTKEEVEAITWQATT